MTNAFNPAPDFIGDVAAFHRACEVPAYFHDPRQPPMDRAALRKKLIEEEVLETTKAIDNGDLEGIADGIADAIYVLVGTALEYGIPLAAVWAEVQRANMAKVDPVTGRVKRRGDGKILKPDGWTPPNITEAMKV